MKVSARDVGSFLENPPNNIRAYLIFGRDLGLISERVLTLTSSIIGNIGDPFRFSELTGKEIAAEPARFIDEVSALSLVGGKRVVRVRLGSENISDSLKVLFDGPGFESLVILEGSNLANTSPVRRLMEKHDMAAVIPCYEDNVATLSLLIDQIMTQNSINLSQAAKEYLLTHLGSDRQVSRRELEKLVTFTGEKHAVSIDDVLAIIDDNGFFSIEEIVYKVASGDRNGLIAGLVRAAVEDVSPIAIIRAIQRHLHRLLLVNYGLNEGKTPAEAMRELRPPVIFTFADRFRHQLTIWSPERIEKAVTLLCDAELDCKSSGMPERALGERVFLRVAQLAKNT